MSETNRSWKSNFQAHRVAAGMGNLDQHFVYHREMQSFPQAMGTPLRVTKRKPTSASTLKQSLAKLKKTLLPGGDRGMVGIAFGLALPAIGSLVLYSFVAMNSGHQTQEMYEMQLQRKEAQPQSAEV
eukprot:TRINITY_DN94404_c0_g1_i1.p1 TRINITY_DN94404_c0_g1~~TRINITY_DN94404_c0_g1_i1.p1  ORF type:complete len:127 (-),score=22.28 TRINITY_DN94404_c0_g1_i1:152-532(-)